MNAIEPGILLEPGSDPGAVNDVIDAWLARAHDTDHDGCFLDVPVGPDGRVDKQLLDAVRSRTGPCRAWTRATITLDQRHAIKQDLHGIRAALQVDALAVQSPSAEVLNFVARDGRVDIISLGSQGGAGAFNDGIASLAAQSGTFIELPFKPLLATRGATRSKLLRAYGKVIDTCHDNHAKVLFPSWATSPVDMKTPWQAIVVLSLLLDISKQEARAIVLHHPADLANPARRGRGRIVVLEPDGGGQAP